MAPRPTRLLISSFLLVGAATASANAQPSPCSALLSGGIYDTSDTLFLRNHFDTVQHWSCESSSRRSESHQYLAGSYKDLDEVIRIGGGSENREAATTQLCTSDYRQVRDNILLVQKVSKASEVLANAFLTCVGYTRVSPSLETWIEVGADPKNITYWISYSGGQTEFTTTSVKSLSIQPASLIKNCRDIPQVGSKITQQRKYIKCERDPSQSVEFILATANGLSKAEVPGVSLSVLELKPIAKDVSGRSERGANTPRPFVFTPDEGYVFMPPSVNAHIVLNKDTNDGDKGTGHFEIVSVSQDRIHGEICTRANHNNSYGSTVVRLEALQGRWMDHPYDASNPEQVRKLIRATNDAVARASAWKSDFRGNIGAQCPR